MVHRAGISLDGAKTIGKVCALHTLFQWFSAFALLTDSIRQVFALQKPIGFADGSYRTVF